MSLTVNPANNRVTSFGSYDANGNQTVALNGLPIAYDAENRIVWHELGHIYEGLFGLGSTLLVNDSPDAQGSDSKAAAANEYNTKLVQVNCFP